MPRQELLPLRELLLQPIRQRQLRRPHVRQLRQRRDQAETEEERQTVERAARFGLAALDHREMG